MKGCKLVMFVLLFVLAACGITYLLPKPMEPKFQNRSMGQWLQLLNTETNSSKNPLRVTRIIEDAPSCTIEVPLSYDLAKQHDFHYGNLHLIINERYVSPTCWRGTNGNCLLTFDKSYLSLGSNRIQVDFFINNPSDIDHPLRAKGPMIELISSNSPP
jgi:hypothetical protein